jgi:vacuolar protein sorting-associated protein 45
MASHVYDFQFKQIFFLITAEDMAKFVDNYPEYRKMHGNVSKHVTLVTEMSNIVEERRLMLVSEMEQDLACNSGQVAAFEVLHLF